MVKSTSFGMVTKELMCITYEIWRGSSPKQMFKIDDVPAANFTYTDLNAPVGLIVL